MTPEHIAASVFYVLFSRGDFALPHLKKIIENKGHFISPSFYGKVPHWQNDKFCIDIYNEICLLLKQQPKGSIAELASIMQGVSAIKNLEGDYVEIGVFSGTSALAALLYMKRLKVTKRCYLLDTYSGFSYEESSKSCDIKWHGTHTNYSGFSGQNAISRIVNLTASTNQEVKVKEFNVCQDELPKEIEKIAMANIDVDMYEATKFALEKVAPKIVVGGIITTEDPAATFGLYGAYYALHEFLESPIGKKFISLRSESTYFLIRKPDEI